MNHSKTYKDYLVPSSLLAIILVVASSGGVFAQEETNIRQSLVGKTVFEKADVKAEEIASVVKNGVYDRSDVRIEIVDIQAIEGGVDVFARAWKDGKQIGFGDGTVDMERFRIFNPPILVPEPNGDIIREWTDEETGKTRQRKLSENPQEALLQVIEHNLSVMKNIHGDEKIVRGKRGNTTITIFPDADPETTSVDGYARSGGQSSWSATRDATNAIAAGSDSTPYSLRTFKDGTTEDRYGIVRLFFLFDTSSIDDASVISSATFSMHVNSAAVVQTPDYMVLGLSSPASSTDIVTGDFDALTLNNPTEYATRLSSGTTAGVWKDFPLNSNGLAAITKTGITKFSVRLAHDVDNNAPADTTYYGIADGIDMAEGASDDPKLVIEINSDPTAPTSLLAEGQTNPTNISDPTPEFSAIYNDPDSNDLAPYYRIQVATSSGFSGLYWDSGTTTMATTTQGSRSPDLSYTGSTLASSTTYYWRIKFSDDTGAEGAWSTETATFRLAEPPTATKARKASDESVQNSATLQDDDYLVIALQANKQYIIDGMLFVSAGSATPDLKIAFTSPLGSTLSIGYLNDADNGVITSAGVASSNITVPGSSVKIPVHFSGTISTASTTGNVALQWAQNTSNSNATTIHAGSFIRAEEI